jgi:hypothetical protein
MTPPAGSEISFKNFQQYFLQWELYKAQRLTACGDLLPYLSCTEVETELLDIESPVEFFPDNYDHMSTEI